MIPEGPLTPDVREIKAWYHCWGCKKNELLHFPAAPEVATTHPWPPSAVRCDCGEIMNLLPDAYRMEE